LVQYLEGFEVRRALLLSEGRLELLLDASVEPIEPLDSLDTLDSIDALV
jgi:hypothetical protein